MNWSKKVYCVAKQAAAAGDIDIFYNVLNKDLAKRKDARKRAKMSRRKNRKKK